LKSSPFTIAEKVGDVTPIMAVGPAVTVHRIELVISAIAMKEKATPDGCSYHASFHD
jgi:hypothetical protein